MKLNDDSRLNNSYLNHDMGSVVPDHRPAKHITIGGFANIAKHSVSVGGNTHSISIGRRVFGVHVFWMQIFVVWVELG
jgi:hypothetical protein